MWNKMLRHTSVKNMQTVDILDRDQNLDEPVDDVLK